MSKIKVLDENLINQIAAGEVIERPASVVKELVENSLDSGADQITVELENGGKKSIKITDNGSGMTKDDLDQAIQRHATSKIMTKEDLFKISTLGFRGEALPSIASISNMKIISRPQESKKVESYALNLEGSKVLGIDTVAANEGTIVEVKDIFCRIPARLKFLKGDATEFSHVQNFISRIILARSDVSFLLIHNGKTALQSKGLKDQPELALKNAVGAIFGNKVAKNLKKIEIDTPEITVSGFVSDPIETRGDRNGQVFFVNNRAVVSSLINKAVDESVRDIVFGKHYPYIFMFIDIDYQLVDVNVHPTKKEVRFVKPGEIFSIVRSAVRNAITKTAIKNNDVIDQSDIGEKKTDHIPQVSSAPAKFDFRTVSDERVQEIDNSVKSVISEAISAELSEQNNNITILGQVYSAYVVLADNEELLLMDQHAAHERIIYEGIITNFQDQNISQSLLLPENIELTEEKKQVLEENKELLQKFGYDWEDFSATSIVLRSVPVLVSKKNLKDLLLEVLDDLVSYNESISIDVLKEKIAAFIACKAAVKAGDILEISEIRSLVKDLFAAKNYQTCPHGRPTILNISQNDLEKMFLRK